MNFREGMEHCLRENLMTVLRDLQDSSQAGYLLSLSGRGNYTCNAPRRKILAVHHRPQYVRPFKDEFTQIESSVGDVLLSILHAFGDLCDFDPQSLYVQQDGTFNCRGTSLQSFHTTSGTNPPLVDGPYEVTGNIILGYELPKPFKSAPRVWISGSSPVGPLRDGDLWVS